MNSIHKTKGIVLKCVKYGDTSLIASIYTELFGVQSYIIKGARKTNKKGNNNNNYFLPSSILDLQVYHNDLKHLQFIKEFQWSSLYSSIHFDVIKNAAAMFIVELLHHSIKQPETNPDLFYFIETYLLLLDTTNDNTIVANIPLHFALKLADELGFGIQGSYNETTAVLDLQQGFYINETPIHPYFIENKLAEITSQIILVNHIADISSIKLNQQTRRLLIDFYIQFFALHITNFTTMKSVEVLREVL